MKIKHPTLPVSREVRDDQAESWLAAGWLSAGTPAHAKSEPAPEPAEDTPKLLRRRKAD